MLVSDPNLAPEPECIPVRVSLRQSVPVPAVPVLVPVQVPVPVPQQ
jgi:hypothetical protein